MLSHSLPKSVSFSSFPCFIGVFFPRKIKQGRMEKPGKSCSWSFHSKTCGKYTFDTIRLSFFVNLKNEWPPLKKVAFLVTVFFFFLLFLTTDFTTIFHYQSDARSKQTVTPLDSHTALFSQHYLYLVIFTFVPGHSASRAALGEGLSWGDSITECCLHGVWAEWAELEQVMGFSDVRDRAGDEAGPGSSQDPSESSRRWG